MAKYTIELRKICDYLGREEVENWFKDYNVTDYLLPSQIEQIDKFHIFNKDKLASKIVDYYFMREIGQETIALFKHYVKITMREIMETQLQFLYTKSLDYNPLINVDYTETFKRIANGESSSSNNGSSASNSSNNADSLVINSDTPQRTN